MANAALEIVKLDAGYGSAQVLFDVSFAIESGAVMALLGRNGMGKSTLIKSIVGLASVRAGSIQVEGKDVAGWPSYRVARAGVGLVPEGRQIFTDLTVAENLVATARPALAQEKPCRLDARSAQRPQLFPAGGLAAGHPQYREVQRRGH